VNVPDETYALVGDDGGQPASGIGQAGPDSPHRGIVVCFPVDDVDSALARAETLGGTCVLDPVDTLVSRIAVFTDPDGNRIGLVSR
jgi:predicted enzyme related to lactoylglutathione lyase